MSFGTKFRILREMKRLSQADCDEIFDLTRGTISNWENGHADPDIELLPDIASFFGVTIWALTNGLPLAC